MGNNSAVICFGEMLWDVFPHHQKPGGAPLNVAVHLKNFGLEPTIISRIGHDESGEKLLEYVSNQQLKTNFIQEDSTHPTGLVKVSVARSGDATYDIVYPSAWDFIDIPLQLDMTDYILIYGSLASRNAISKSTLFHLMEHAKLSLFDVNFRAPHYSRLLIESLLQKANIVKLNEDELQIIGGWFGIKNSVEDICLRLTSLYNLTQIIVTLGDQGAAVFSDGKLYRHAGFAVKVADTVGSGDSFLAAYLAHFLQGTPIERSLEMACATGAFVASQQGATPRYNTEDILKIIT